MEKLIFACTNFLFFCFVISVASAETATLDKAINERVQAQNKIVRSQKNIDRLAKQTRYTEQEYRATIRKTDSLQTYNTQLSKLIKKQKESLNGIQQQLDNAEETQRSIVPLMLKMIDVLEKFVHLDLPFLMEERVQRVHALQTMMDRPDITLPYKYRRIMEAYQIETEYGRTIESYNEVVDVNGQDFTVNMLRIGRLTMAFQTLDGEISGIWNKQTKKWEMLSNKYNRAIKKGLQIANKQAPPDFIEIPVQVME